MHLREIRRQAQIDTVSYYSPLPSSPASKERTRTRDSEGKGCALLKNVNLFLSESLVLSTNLMTLGWGDVVSLNWA